MASIENVTKEGFKALFKRDFPYLPVWQDMAYFVDDVSYLAPNFYKSLTDGNATEPPSDFWELTKDSIDNYVSDADIERAFQEAKINFNSNFFVSDEDAQMVFYYLAAHYLVVDLNNAMNSLSFGNIGLTQSKSVGSVSESYALPQWVLNDPVLSQYNLTGYGRKYLSLIMPYLKGNVILCLGRTTYG